MTRGLRYVAPSGAPIRVTDVVRWAGQTLSAADVDEALRQEIRSRFDVKHSFLTSTGRAGMTVLMKALRRLAPPHRDEVVVPSYTCYSVAASIVKAGLRIRIVDISPDTLDYDADQLSGATFDRVLAIVATNLYGLPNDLPMLDKLARDKGVFLIDDAAQAMGASVGGRRSGTWGHAGLFSFDKGKNVSAIDGGVLVSNSDEVAEAIEQEMRDLVSPGPMVAGVSVAKVLAYSIMLRPWLYWIPNGIPQLGLGKTVYTTDFPIQRPSRPLIALALSKMRDLEWLTSTRISNASALVDGVRTVAGVRTITPRAGSEPVYLRVPILVVGTTPRGQLLTALQKEGIGATASYPASLADVPELRGSIVSTPQANGGRYVAQHLMTLPTHPFVTTEDINRTLAALSLDVAGSPSQRPTKKASQYSEANPL